MKHVMEINSIASDTYFFVEAYENPNYVSDLGNVHVCLFCKLCVFDNHLSSAAFYSVIKEILFCAMQFSENFMHVVAM